MRYNFMNLNKFNEFSFAKESFDRRDVLESYSSICWDINSFDKNSGKVFLNIKCM